MNATRSWNAAIVALALCLAVFLASVIATAYGWHTVATGRAAGGSALALVACGFWLHSAAARFESLDPEPDEDERAECPYESCPHNQPEAGREA